ncbi:MAG: 30S ribosomal protein S9 [Nitrospinota bacterium]
MADRYYATGKRKTAVARVWLTPGEGRILVNRVPVEEYFRSEPTRLALKTVFDQTETWGQFDAHITVKGGGPSGQAGAIRHGIAKALVEADPKHRAQLKRAGFLTRDPRVKERKKYGQKGARARFQFSKR